MNKFIIELSNGFQCTATFYDNPVADFFKKSLKHLQHIKVPTNPRDYLYYINDKDLSIESFINAGTVVNVKVDANELGNQHYLNELHVLYEQGYQKSYDPHWLEYHELLHTVEAHNTFLERNIPKGFLIDYRQYAGPIIKDFNRTYLSHAVTDLNPGVCYATWQELGKVPMQYWIDGEPSSQNRINELAKPWLTLKPTMFVVFEQLNALPTNQQMDDFLSWFAPFQKNWMQKYNLDTILIFDVISKNSILQGGKIPVAVIDYPQELDIELTKKNYVTRVKLI